MSTDTNGELSFESELLNLWLLWERGDWFLNEDDPNYDKEHDRRFRGAIVKLHEAETTRREQEFIEKNTPITIMGKTLDEVVVILSALELERIADMKMTIRHLDDWMKLVRENHHKAMQKAINKSFETFITAHKSGKEQP